MRLLPDAGERAVRWGQRAALSPCPPGQGQATSRSPWAPRPRAARSVFVSNCLSSVLFLLPCPWEATLLFSPLCQPEAVNAPQAGKLTSVPLFVLLCLWCSLPGSNLPLGPARWQLQARTLQRRRFPLLAQTCAQEQGTSLKHRA